MVARYIPTLMAIGAVLAGYRILSTKNIMEAFGPHQLMEQYDYIIGACIMKRFPLICSYR